MKALIKNLQFIISFFIDEKVHMTHPNYIYIDNYNIWYVSVIFQTPVKVQNRLFIERAYFIQFV